MSVKAKRLAASDAGERSSVIHALRHTCLRSRLLLLAKRFRVCTKSEVCNSYFYFPIQFVMLLCRKKCLTRFIFHFLFSASASLCCGFSSLFLLSVLGHMLRFFVRFVPFVRFSIKTFYRFGRWSRLSFYFLVVFPDAMVIRRHCLLLSLARRLLCTVLNERRLMADTDSKEWTIIRY